MTVSCRSSSPSSSSPRPSEPGSGLARRRRAAGPRRADGVGNVPRRPFVGVVSVHAKQITRAAVALGEARYGSLRAPGDQPELVRVEGAHELLRRLGVLELGQIKAHHLRPPAGRARLSAHGRARGLVRMYGSGHAPELENVGTWAFPCAVIRYRAWIRTPLSGHSRAEGLAKMHGPGHPPVQSFKCENVAA